MAGNPFEDLTWTQDLRDGASTVWPLACAADFAWLRSSFDKALSIMEERQQKSGWGDNISNGSTLRTHEARRDHFKAARPMCSACHAFVSRGRVWPARAQWQHTSHGLRGEWMRGRWEFGAACLRHRWHEWPAWVKSHATKPKHATLLSLALQSLHVSRRAMWRSSRCGEGPKKPMALVLRHPA